MITNKYFDEIFENDFSESTIIFKNNINATLENYIQNPENYNNIKFLNTNYWDIVYFIVKKKLFLDNKLEFTSSEKLIIDFGYISDQLIKSNNLNTSELIDNEKLLKSIQINTTFPYNLKFLTITDWLCEQLNDFLGFNKINEFENEFDQIVNKINKLSLEKSILIESKNKLDAEYLNNNQSEHISQIKNINLNIESKLEKYAMLKACIHSELLLKPEDRIEYVNIENTILKNKDERKRLLKKLNFDDKYLMNITFLEDMIVQKEQEIFECIVNIGKHKKQIDEFIYSKKDTPVEEKDKFLKAKIDELKNIIEVMAKSCKSCSIMFLKTIPDYTLANNLINIIQTITNFDQKFLENIKNNKSAITFIISPGLGCGNYDNTINSFIIHQIPVLNFQNSIINAIANFHWEHDIDNKLKQSFSKLNINRYVNNVYILKQSFIKYYIQYINNCLSSNNISYIKDLDYEINKWLISFISYKDIDKVISTSNILTSNIQKTENLNTNLLKNNDQNLQNNNIKTINENINNQINSNIISTTNVKDTTSIEICFNKEVNIANDKKLNNKDNSESKINIKVINEIKEIPKNKKLPGEFIIEESKEENNNVTNENILNKDNEKFKNIKIETNNNLINEINHESKIIENVQNNDTNTVLKEIDNNISVFVNENIEIIKNKIHSIFKFENILVEKGSSLEKINIKILDIDINKFKHFLNLMSVQTKFYKFMNSILKDNENN